MDKGKYCFLLGRKKYSAKRTKGYCFILFAGLVRKSNRDGNVVVDFLHSQMYPGGCDVYLIFFFLEKTCRWVSCKKFQKLLHRFCDFDSSGSKIRCFICNQAFCFSGGCICNCSYEYLCDRNGKSSKYGFYK